MSKRFKLGAALVALAILPAAVMLFHVSAFNALMAAALIGPILFGTATVTYANPLDGSGPHQGYAGGTTPPTTVQAQTLNAVVADVNFGDTDTTATITHNFQLTAAQLAADWPTISHEIMAFATANQPVNPIISVAVATNSVTLNKQSVTSSGGTVRYWIRRPWSASS